MVTAVILLLGWGTISPRPAWAQDSTAHVKVIGKRRDVDYGDPNNYKFGGNDFSLSTPSPGASFSDGAKSGHGRRPVTGEVTGTAAVAVQSPQATDVPTLVAALPDMLRDYLDDPRPKSDWLPPLLNPKIVDGSVHAKPFVRDSYVGEAIFRNAETGAPVRTRFVVQMPSSLGGRPEVTQVQVTANSSMPPNEKAMPRAAENGPAPSAASPAIAAAQAKAAIADYLAPRMKNDGAFLVSDPALGAALKLVLVKVKTETLKTVDGGGSRVCADFLRSDTRQSIDVDFFLTHHDEADWSVGKFLIHKIDGEPRFYYKDETPPSPTTTGAHSKP